MDRKKVWKKTGFGILFVAACFAAMYILMEFSGNVLMVIFAALVLLITAFLFFNEIFSDKAKKWVQEEADVSESAKDTVSVGTDGEFRLKIAKHMKEMESTQKDLIDVLKNQNAMLQSQMENMEQVIFTLSEKQANQTKSVIKFNKENARQLAISERETLEYVMIELKKAMKGNLVVSEEPVAAPIAEMEEVGAEELFEVSELPGDDELVMPEAPVMEETFAAEEPAVVPETVPETDSLAGLGGDPNAMMSAEDIANLFAMNAAEAPAAEAPAEEVPEIQDMPEDIDLSALFEDMAAGALEEAAEEPAKEEPVAVAEAAPETDPLAGLGGDPNAMMTPEDIAKLLASMGQ